MSGSSDEDPALTERVVSLEADMKWVKDTLSKIDARTWWILGSVIVTLLVTLIGILRSP